MQMLLQRSKPDPAIIFSILYNTRFIIKHYCKVVRQKSRGSVKTVFLFDNSKKIHLLTDYVFI